MTWDSFIKKPQAQLSFDEARQTKFPFHKEIYMKPLDLQRSPIRKKWCRFFHEYQYTTDNVTRLINLVIAHEDFAKTFPKNPERVITLIRERHVGRSLQDISESWGLKTFQGAARLENKIIKFLKDKEIRV